MGYPLVPGYETVGAVVERGRRMRAARSARRVRSRRALLRPRARPVRRRGLAGSSSPALASSPIDDALGEHGVLLALAATALHALEGAAPGGRDLIVGHGVLGRLLARLAMLRGGEPPVVWEKQPARAAGAGRLRGDRRRRTIRGATIARSSTSAAIRRLLDTLVAATRAGRRDRARRLLRRAARFRLSARLHARGADPRRRAMARGRSRERSRAGRVGRAVARRPDHASPRGARGAPTPIRPLSATRAA